MINLCFHGIGTPQRRLEPGEARYWISSDFYTQVLDEIADRSDVALSFDDGNASDIRTGLEGLLQHGRTATFFVLAGRLDQRGSLGVADLQELRRQGMTIGTHGMDHIPWRGLDSRTRNREFVQAREVLSEAVGAPVEQAALPLGRYDRSVLRRLRRLGYTRVFSSDRRSTSKEAWLQPRFSVCAEDTIANLRSAMLTAPPWFRHVRVRAVGLVKSVR